MHTTIIIILTIILISAVLVMLYITLYNKIQFSKTRIDEAEKAILEELTIRYDLIMSCEEDVTKNTKKELSLFTDLKDLKEKNISSYDFEEKIKASLDTLNLIMKDYPKLADKKNIKETLRKIEESDTRIEAAKSFYNKNNINLNRLLKKFPSNIIGKIMKVKIKPNYKGKEVFNEIDDAINIKE